MIKHHAYPHLAGGVADCTGCKAHLEQFAQKAIEAYVTALLWSSIGEDGEPLDATYTSDDLDESARVSIDEDVRDFVIAQWEDVRDLDPEQVGHDFLLTRDHHGTGFWDRGLGDRGDRLTKASHPYGDSGAYVGDNGRIYVM